MKGWKALPLRPETKQVRLLSPFSSIPLPEFLAIVSEQEKKNTSKGIRSGKEEKNYDYL